MDIQKALETIKRGTLEIISEEQLKEKLLLDRPLRIKFGADPTAPDIHLGHTVILRKLRQLQDLGHKLIFIIGDFTARIGDPSGRDVTRPPLSQEEIEENAATYKEQVFKIVDRERTEIVYNSQWLDRLGTEGMIRLASHYTVARMLERDDFKKRYESQKEITILEFLYPLLQGYDSVHLKADIEVGGGDQKFNLLVGRELQRDYNQKPQAIITLPLLEGTDGVRKMSKSYGNYIGVDEEPKEMFGKIMSLPDALMSKYFELLTDIPLEEVEGLHPKEAKKLLSREIVKFYYDRPTALGCDEEFERVFKMKEVPAEIPEFRPTSSSMNIVELIFANRLAKSKGEARRLISQGGVKIEGEKITDSDLQVVFDKEQILKVGKRRFLRLLTAEGSLKTNKERRDGRTN